MFRTGVLLNSGDAIERLAEVDRVVFDKTGTLTLPELDVTNAADVPRDVFELAGRLALASHHPVAAAVARASGAKSAIGRGRGDRRRRACAAWSTGSKSGSAGRRSATRTRSPTRSCAADPEASVVAFRHGETRHVFAVRQRLRADAAGAIATLRKAGIEVEILSGDREPAVRHAAATLGIHEWRAGVTPADKIARIEELKRQGVKVLMVGDGMNDAPALAAAHVSMSPVSATHLSQATADLVFLGDRLAPGRRGDRLLAQGAAADAAKPVAGGRLQSAWPYRSRSPAWRRRWSPPPRCRARRCW